jgi:O-methyltransferase domain
MNEMNPFETLRQISAGYCLARAVHVLAELNVADALGETAQPASQLAQAVGANADALWRVLRLTSAHGVFEQKGDTYQHSPASRMLRTDHPQSMRAFVRMFGLAINWDAYRELEYSVKSGRRAMEKTLPEGVWSYLGQHPEANNIFNSAMLAKAHAQIPAIVQSANFFRFKLVGDIGGGRGHLLRAILEASPATKGILFDLPHVVNEASDLASSRLTLQGGDFFKDALPKCDAYILMEVIHDWPDKEAVTILRAVRQAAPPGATLFLIEAIVPEGPEPDWSKILDIHMLTLLGGKQRTLKEYKALLGQANFGLKEAIDTGTGISIIEALARQT